MAIKGLSPLIASVLLIAFTMVIAGMMATWATNLVKAQTGEMECIGALSIDPPSFSSTSVTVKIRNTDTKVSLSSLQVYLEYSDVSKNKNYTASSGGVADPLGPGAIDWFTHDTSDSTRPVSIEVVAGNCPSSPASADF